MKLSELSEKVDDLIISNEDIDLYKIYLWKKEISKWQNIMSMDDENLDIIFNISRGFSSNMSLNYLKNLLLNEIEKKHTNFDKNSFEACSTFFSLIRKIWEIDSDLVERLYKLYDISFEWKYWFYHIDTEFDIDSANDFLIRNINKFKNCFQKNFWLNDCIFIPYNFRNNYYYILHYNESKNNSFMEWVFMTNVEIATKKSCIFFLWENDKTKQKFLVIKQVWKTNIEKSIVKVFNKLFDSDVSFYKYPIWNLAVIDWETWIKNPSNWTINIKNLNLHSILFDSVISFSWENVINDMKKLKGTTGINIFSANIQYECISNTTQKTVWHHILNWKATKYFVEYQTDSQMLWYFLSLLNSSWLIQNSDVDNINTKFKIITDCLLEWESFVLWKSDEIWELQEYVSKAINVMNPDQKEISLDHIDFKSLMFKGYNQWEESIIWNLKVWLDLEKLFQKNIDWCIKYERCNDWKVSKFSFPGVRTKYLKWVVLLFAKNIEDVCNLLEKKNKYLIFLKNEKIEWELIKQLISQRIISKIYWIKKCEELLSRWKIFIKENVSWYWNQSEDMLNIKQISESSDWDEFEDAISLILEPFFNRYIPLWKWIRWISLPDWMILDWWVNIFYDAKSTKDIFSYLKSEELRKFKSYIDILFPDDQDNLFICFWPTTSDDILWKIEERVEMKELLQWGKKIIYVWADCLEFLYKIISNDLFNNAWKFLKTDWLVELFKESCEIWHFRQLKKEKLKNDFIKYGFTGDFDKILKKIDKRTESKVDYKREIEKLKDYAYNL